jgi:hypothetical protein
MNTKEQADLETVHVLAVLLSYSYLTLGSKNTLNLCIREVQIWTAQAKGI